MVGGYLQAISVSRIAVLLNLLLVVLLAYTLAGLTWQVIAGSSESYVATVAPPAHTPGTTSRPLSLELLAERHLLGRAGVAPVAERSEVLEAPETRLNLELKGVFAVDRPDAAMAIIASSGRDEQSYRVGQNVAGAATVHQILADRVILKRGERFEALMLPKDQIPEQGSSPRGGGGSAAVRTLPGLQARILRNPQQAIGMIDARPVMESGQLKGYRLRPGKERALFAQAGLSAGDVVTRINGIPLSDTARMGELMQQFGSSPRVDLTVERGGRPVTLSLDLK